MPRTFYNKTNVPGLNGDFRPRVEFKTFGKWDETIRMIGKLSPAIKQSSLKAQMKVCKVIARTVKAHLRNQDLGWRPLQPKYAAKKAKLRMDPRILIGQGTYYHSIEVWKKTSGNMIFVGVKKGIYTHFNGKRSQLEVAQIAAIHEFASGRKIAKRPLWNPSIAELGGTKGIQKMFINSLIWWLRQEGIKLDNTTVKINNIPYGLE